MVVVVVVGVGSGGGRSGGYLSRSGSRWRRGGRSSCSSRLSRSVTVFACFVTQPWEQTVLVCLENNLTRILFVSFTHGSLVVVETSLHVLSHSPGNKLYWFAWKIIWHWSADNSSFLFEHGSAVDTETASAQPLHVLSHSPGWEQTALVRLENNLKGILTQHVYFVCTWIHLGIPWSKLSLYRSRRMCFHTILRILHITTFGRSLDTHPVKSRSSWHHTLRHNQFHRLHAQVSETDNSVRARRVGVTIVLGGNCAFIHVCACYCYPQHKWNYQQRSCTPRWCHNCSCWKLRIHSRLCMLLHCCRNQNCRYKWNCQQCSCTPRWRHKQLFALESAHSYTSVHVTVTHCRHNQNCSHKWSCHQCSCTPRWCHNCSCWKLRIHSRLCMLLHCRRNHNYRHKWNCQQCSWTPRWCHNFRLGIWNLRIHPRLCMLLHCRRDQNFSHKWSCLQCSCTPRWRHDCSYWKLHSWFTFVVLFQNDFGEKQSSLSAVSK